MEINNPLINLKKDTYLPKDLIYSLNLIKFHTLKSYIKTNLAYKFIQYSKSVIRAPILVI